MTDFETILAIAAVIAVILIVVYLLSRRRDRNSVIGGTLGGPRSIDRNDRIR